MNSTTDDTASGPASDPGHPPAAATARRLVRALDRAALATAQRDGAGWPYPSLALVATDLDATPLLLISALADHTANIARDDRVGLLFDGTAGLDEPLTGPRVSVLGRAVRTDDLRHRARYLARHPSAGFYAGFADFAVYKILVERAHLVAGFGRIHWIPADDLLFGGSDIAALAQGQADIVQHMNEERGAAIALCATALLGLPGDGWGVTGVDPEGLDLRRGGAVARLDFERPAGDAQAVQAELARLESRARGKP